MLGGWSHTRTEATRSGTANTTWCGQRSTGIRCRGALPGVIARDCANKGDGDLRGVDQPGSCPYADRDSATVVGIEGGTVFQGQEFAQIVDGVWGLEKAVLGPAFMSEGILGRFERKCDG